MIVSYRERFFTLCVLCGKKNELRWYRDTLVVLMMDEACFYFYPERRAEPEIEVFGDKMKQLSFDELTDQMMNLYRESKYADALKIVEQNADRFPEHLAPQPFGRCAY